MLKFFISIIYLFLFAMLINSILVYFPYKYRIGFLSEKSDFVLNSKAYLISFYIHIISSFIPLIFGFLQFIPAIFNKNKTIHRFLGKAYIFVILLLAGPSGLFMSFHANGGLIAKVAFLTQSIFWIVLTLFVAYFALKKNFTKHVQFAILSYSLTLSAFSLRLENSVVNSFYLFNEDLVYQWTSWLSWTFNLFIGFILLYFNADKKLIKQFEI